MRTSDFSAILQDALEYSGNDSTNISDETFWQFRGFASSRMREAWEMSPWPDICRVESFSTTIDGDGVNYFVQPEDASEILGIYNRNPQETTRAVRVDFQLYDTGTEKRVILAKALDSGFVHYRLPCPRLGGKLYSSTVVYYQDAQIYFDMGSSSGTYTPVIGRPHTANFYKCLASSTTAGQSPSTNPELWEKIEIPYVFSQYMAWGSVANWLVSEGQVQEAAAIEMKAKEILNNEHDKLYSQQAQAGRINMTNTY